MPLNHCLFLNAVHVAVLLPSLPSHARIAASNMCVDTLQTHLNSTDIVERTAINPGCRDEMAPLPHRSITGRHRGDATETSETQAG
ncbi:hypothetical protein B0T25DRAFT_49980 [Lasiosphaeria hispida]|uniref:Secreted protein n=1 Tax=Lasiosphaeria hispida TaxID=260671 RepID=A0AAJ0HVF5_9PEZI|nr:hypothetical protein B0T25DRAFT_49980 [Lasiosphaeria hispida]